VDFDWSVSFFEPELMGASEEVAFLWSGLLDLSCDLKPFVHCPGVLSESIFESRSFLLCGTDSVVATAGLFFPVSFGSFAVADLSPVRRPLILDVVSFFEPGPVEVLSVFFC
jgi:hypothetical protein